MRCVFCANLSTLASLSGDGPGPQDPNWGDLDLPLWSATDAPETDWKIAKLCQLLLASTILDRIKWEIEAPLPPIQWCTRATRKTRHIFINEMEGGGGEGWS